MENYKLEKLNIDKMDISSKNILLEIFLSIHNKNFKKQMEIKYFSDIFSNGNYIKYVLRTLETGDIVAYIIFYDTFTAIDLFEIAVKKDKQQKGLGQLILGESIKDIFSQDQFSKREIEDKRIMLEVNENNKNAIKLYEKMEFKKIAVRKNYYGENENGIIMEKEVR